MQARSMVWLVVAGCSAPAPHQPPTTTPSDDDQAAIAWQKTHPQPDAAPDAKPPWRFDWKNTRAAMERWRGKELGTVTCDPRNHGYPTGTEDCLHGHQKLELAGKIYTARGAGPDTARVGFDLGMQEMLTAAWWVALVDKDGKPITEWAHPESIGGTSSEVGVHMSEFKVEIGGHVAAVQDIPE